MLNELPSVRLYLPEITYLIILQTYLMIKFAFLLLVSILGLQTAARASFPSLTNSAFEKQCITRTNALRALHKNTPSIIIDHALVSYAQTRCAAISQSPYLSAGHYGLAPGYGENLYWGASSSPFTPNCDSAVNSWYSESSNYNYANPGFSSGTGHFTQLIWAATTRQGCATCGGQGSQWYEVYIVCVYKPPGNYVGQFAKNVNPLK